MRKRALFIALAVPLLAAGCYRHRAAVSEPRAVVVVHGVDDVWDGHAWIVVTGHVHGPGCGHYWHHGCWHLYPEDYVYLEAGYAPYGVYVDYVLDDDPYVWDGSTWIYIEGHVHGPGCGHFYHHGRWHLYDERHVYQRPDQGPWGARIEPRREPPRVETPDRRPEPPKPQPPRVSPPPKPEPPPRPKPPPKPKPPH